MIIYEMLILLIFYEILKMFDFRNFIKIIFSVVQFTICRVISYFKNENDKCIINIKLNFVRRCARHDREYCE